MGLMELVFREKENGRESMEYLTVAMVMACSDMLLILVALPLVYMVG